ncbi:hypothetical protein GF319_07180 [Candidatus Bathyarchaeota archaeon]|jgi:hypothetical protein|nr:hypothetical protein [Candidatus Bathyarchaeota archaeon]
MPLNEFWRSSKKVQLSYGNLVKLRPETEEDLEAVWDMFSSLSPETLQFLPIPFTRE